MPEDIVLKVEKLSKIYRLGQIGTGTISHDLNRWWARVRGKEDPYAKIGTVNDRTKANGTNEYVYALKDINFEVKKGEVLGIIGKNGAGKSTLLKVISQITAPTSGSIKARGRIASLLEVGTGMHPEMTGKENVYLNGTILGMTRREIDKKFDEIMDFAGCAKYADTPVKRYSSGMKVRLGFAVAAFLEPEILIVDEVLAVGDAEFQKKAIGKMQDISSGEGRTVLFVSHNMASVRSLCHNGLLIENGRNRYYDKINDVVDCYLGFTKQSVQTNNSYSGEYVELKSSINYSAKPSVKGENEIFVTLEILFKKKFSTTRIGINLFDMKGNQLLCSKRLISLNNLPSNFIEVTYQIPSYLLPQNDYSLSVDIGVPNETKLLHAYNIGRVQVTRSRDYTYLTNEKNPALLDYREGWILDNELLGNEKTSNQIGRN